MQTQVQTDERSADELERVIAIGSGAVLVLFALRRAPLSMVLAAAGWTLIYRGVTSRRPLGDAMKAAGELAAPRAARMPSEELVDETVEESFPASDPPGWHSGSSFTQVSE